MKKFYRNPATGDLVKICYTSKNEPINVSGHDEISGKEYRKLLWELAKEGVKAKKEAAAARAQKIKDGFVK